MENFSVKEGTSKDNPVLEILINNQRFGEYFANDENFSFGVKEAKMIITCIEIIETFFRSNGKSPDANKPTSRKNEGYNLNCVCTKQNAFIRGGKVIEQPYLKLTEGETSFGFGLTKAKAILTLMEEIEFFIIEYDKH
jgi:hypothetical protein